MELFFRATGAGRPLIILHGLFGQSDNWNTLAKKFGSEGLLAITVDQRNHGLSPHSNEFNYEVMARDISELIEAQGWEDSAILGHSMGAKTALYFESLFPGKVRSYIFADMAAKRYPPHHDAVIRALKAVDFDAIRTRGEAEAILAMHIADNGTRQFLLKNIHWKGETMAWRFNLEAISAGYENIMAPVPPFKSSAHALIVRGDRSDYVKDADLADFSQRFARVTDVTIENSGHWVHAEQPAAFSDAVMNFIKAEAA